jgi:putative membrane protein
LGAEADFSLVFAGALVAFGHFLAFFALAAALVLQLTLITESISAEVAKRVQRADRVAGLSAVLILVFGFLRVFYFEKGSDYYFSNLFFQVKIGLFILTAVISLYPTIQYARWNRELGQGIVLNLTASGVKRLKTMIHWELVLIGGIVLCASLMAKGFGV